MTALASRPKVCNRLPTCSQHIMLGGFVWPNIYKNISKIHSSTSKIHKYIYQDIQNTKWRRGRPAQPRRHGPARDRRWSRAGRAGPVGAWYFVYLDTSLYIWIYTFGYVLIYCSYIFLYAFDLYFWTLERTIQYEQISFYVSHRGFAPWQSAPIEICIPTNHSESMAESSAVCMYIYIYIYVYNIYIYIY